MGLSLRWLPAGVRSADRRGDDHRAGRRRHLLQHGRLPDPRLPRDRSRHLPLRCLHRGVPERVRTGAPDRSDIEDPTYRQYVAFTDDGRALVEGTDGRDDPPAPTGPRDRPADRRWRRVRPAGIEHGAGSPAPGLAVQRLRQHEVGGELAPAHGLEQRLGGLRRLPRPARRRVAGAATSAAGAGARERRRPRLLRDRSAGPSPRSDGCRRRSRPVRLPRSSRGRVPRPPLVRAGRAPHRRSRERRRVPRMVPGPRRVPLPLRRRPRGCRDRRAPRPVRRGDPPRSPTPLRRRGGPARPVRGGRRNPRVERPQRMAGRGARAA